MGSTDIGTAPNKHGCDQKQRDLGDPGHYMAWSPAQPDRLTWWSYCPLYEDVHAQRDERGNSERPHRGRWTTPHLFIIGREPRHATAPLPSSSPRTSLCCRLDRVRRDCSGAMRERRTT